MFDLRSYIEGFFGERNKTTVYDVSSLEPQADDVPYSPSKKDEGKGSNITASKPEENVKQLSGQSEKEKELQTQIDAFNRKQDAMDAEIAQELTIDDVIPEHGLEVVDGIEHFAGLLNRSESGDDESDLSVMKEYLEKREGDLMAMGKLVTGAPDNGSYRMDSVNGEITWTVIS